MSSKNYKIAVIVVKDKDGNIVEIAKNGIEIKYFGTNMLDAIVLNQKIDGSILVPLIQEKSVNGEE